MSRHPMLNAVALSILSLHESTHVATLACLCRGIHYSARIPCFVIFTNATTLAPQCCGIAYVANFPPILNAVAFCLQCCSIEVTATLLIFVDALAFNLQCLGIQSIFLLLYSFWIFSFFFRFQCSSYHLQHKIPCKCVQNDHNTNKITK